jgi:GntR family transcriptional regulator
LPSEDRLAEELGLSRVTVNRYAARREGNGASEVEARRLNLRSHTEYGEIGKVTPPERFAIVLDLDLDLDLDKRDSTLLRPRVLYANDDPTQIANSYLP